MPGEDICDTDWRTLQRAETSDGRCFVICNARVCSAFSRKVLILLFSTCNQTLLVVSERSNRTRRHQAEGPQKRVFGSASYLKEDHESRI